MNVNLPITPNHQQSYGVSSQPSLLSPTITTTASTQVTVGGVGDVHICGLCSTRFAEIKEFVAHKRQGCQPGVTSVPGCTTTNLSQLPAAQQPQPQPQAQPTPASVMGVPVGMPHVVLQTATGPPQVYRIVLEPSVPTSTQQNATSLQPPTPILAQTLSGDPVSHLTSPTPVSGHHHVLPHVSHPHHTQGGITQVVASDSAPMSGTMLQLSSVEDTWHTGEAATLASTGVEDDGGLASGGGVENRTLVESCPSNSQNETVDRSSITISRGRLLEDDDDDDATLSTSANTSSTPISTNTTTTITTTMHTEEEDVATFLATQLASQAAPPHPTNVSDQLLSGVSVADSETTHLHITTAPTQPHQLHLTMNQQGDPFSSEIESSGSSHQTVNVKAMTDPEDLSPVDTKANILNTYSRDSLMVHDGIHKEKVCPMKDCNFVTYHNKDLNRHIRKHTGEKPYRCDECGTCFSRGDKLKVHTRIHSNVRPYGCTEEGCHYRAIDSGSLRKHMRTHTNERPYRCQLCPYSARDGSQLTVHLRTHTGDTPFQCMVDNCSAAFKTSSDLRRHERLHTGIKPYKCTVCDYACAIKSNLTVHMRLNHYKGAKFSCTKCEFLGNSRKQLKDHEKSHANVLLQCERCDHVSTSTNGLRQHMLIHSQEKPFQCTYCSFTCKTTGNLRYHVRNKHGCESSKCKRGGVMVVRGRGRGSGAGGNTVGGKRAGRPTCFRSFKCEDCGSGFVREDSYRSHMRQHEKHRMAQAISSKIEPDVFSVVVQDEALMSVEQPGGGGAEAGEETVGEAAGEAGQGVTSFHRLPTDTLHSATLLSPTSAVDGGNGGGGGSGGGETTIQGYSSYVITIDGISTVFPNHVRLAGGGSGGVGTGGHQGDGLGATVQVITGDILAQEATKMTSYEPEDTKLSSFTAQRKEGQAGGEQSLYSVCSPSKDMSEGQEVVTCYSTTTTTTTSTTPSDHLLMQHTITSVPPDSTLDNTSIHHQHHSLGHKPKIE